LVLTPKADPRHNEIRVDMQHGRIDFNEFNVVEIVQEFNSATLSFDTLLSRNRYLYNMWYVQPLLGNVSANSHESKKIQAKMQVSRIRFPALPVFLRSSGTGTGPTHPREYNR
jgi:hypothetical protein